MNSFCEFFSSFTLHRKFFKNKKFTLEFKLIRKIEKEIEKFTVFRCGLFGAAAAGGFGFRVCLLDDGRFRSRICGFWLRFFYVRFPFVIAQITTAHLAFVICAALNKCQIYRSNSHPQHNPFSLKFDQRLEVIFGHFRIYNQKSKICRIYVLTFCFQGNKLVKFFIFSGNFWPRKLWKFFQVIWRFLTSQPVYVFVIMI